MFIISVALFASAIVGSFASCLAGDAACAAGGVDDTTLLSLRASMSRHSDTAMPKGMPLAPGAIHKPAMVELGVFQQEKAQVCGSNVNNWGSQLGDAKSANSSCACERFCLSNPDCVGFTFSTGAHVTQTGSGPLNCWLRATWGDDVDNCGGTCWSGQAQRGEAMSCDRVRRACEAVQEVVDNPDLTCEDAAWKIWTRIWTLVCALQPVPTICTIPTHVRLHYITFTDVRLHYISRIVDRCFTLQASGSSFERSDCVASLGC